MVKTLALWLLAIARVRTREFLAGGQNDPFAGEPVDRGDRFDD